MVGVEDNDRVVVFARRLEVVDQTADLVVDEGYHDKRQGDDGPVLLYAEGEGKLMRAVGRALCQPLIRLLCWQRQMFGEVVRQGGVFGPVHAEKWVRHDEGMVQIGERHRGKEWRAPVQPCAGPVIDSMGRPLFKLERRTTGLGGVIFLLGNSVLAPTHRVDAVDLGARPPLTVSPWLVA